jgi:hypothetical protein
MAEQPRVVTLSEIEAIVSTDTFATRLIEAILNGFVEYSNGKFNAAPIQTLGVAPPLAPFSCGGSVSSIPPSSTNDYYSAQTCVKSGYITDSSLVLLLYQGGQWRLSLSCQFWEYTTIFANHGQTTSIIMR